MKLRLLSLVFPSNYPGFAADSIHVFNRILIASLRRVAPDVEIAVAGPAAMPSPHPSVVVHSFNSGTDKYAVRFGFPWDELAEILGQVRPDFILVNMPEQAGAVAVLARDALRLPCQIISYVHYVPAMVEASPEGAVVSYETSMDARGSGQLLVLRLLEGLVASDLVLVCSRFGIRLLRGLAEFHLGRGVRLPTTKVLAPPVDPGESARASSAEPASAPCFAYNHRLYDEYGTQLIFSLLQQAANRCAPFNVLVTNPTAARTTQRRRLNGRVDDNVRALRELPFVHLRHFDDRPSYFEALGGTWGGIAPYKPNALWSMSVFDVLATGRPVLSFDIASFGEMGLPSEDLVSCDADFLNRLECLTSEPLGGDDRERMRAIALAHSGHRTAERFLALLGERPSGMGG
jgi:hypothetical protein